jgi:hypothetical protein
MKKILFVTAVILFSSLSYADFDDGQRAWGSEEHHEHRHHHNNSYQQGYYQQAPNVYYQQPGVRYYAQPQPQIYYSPQPQVPIYVRPGEINPNLRPPW